MVLEKQVGGSWVPVTGGVHSTAVSAKTQERDVLLLARAGWLRAVLFPMACFESPRIF